MAESVNVKNRDFSSDMIDEDDPLMELSRIIGLEPRRDPPVRLEEPVALRREREIEAAPSPAIHHDEALFDDATQLPDNPIPIDDLQVDFADELIASLEADASVGAGADLVAQPQGQAFEAEQYLNAAPETELDLPDFEVEPVALETEIEPVPHLIISSPAEVSPVAPSIEDELEALLNAANDRKSSLGLRPVENVLEDVEPIEDELGSYSDPVSKFARPVLDPVDIRAPHDDGRIDMNFDAEPEPEVLESGFETAEWDFPESDVQASELPMDTRASATEPDFGELERPTFEMDEEEAATSPETPTYSYEEPEIALKEYHSFEAVAEPVVDTVQHEARTVEVTDEFDIPEFAYEDHDNKNLQQPDYLAYDDEHAPVAPKPVQPEPAALPTSEAVADFDDFDLDQINDAIEELEQERARAFSPEEAAVPVVAASAATASMRRPVHAEREEFVLDRHDDPAVYLEPPMPKSVDTRSVSIRSYLMAAGLGALALVGGIGAYSLTSGADKTATASAPVVLKADAEPVKIAPENPGGSIVPNQDVAVYDKVGNAGAETVKQDTLVSTTEQPVDLAEKAVTRVVLPGPSATQSDEQLLKSEERIDPQATEEESVVAAEVASVSPKRVRTLVVKSDGSLVERVGATPQATDETSAITPIMVKPGADSLIPAKKVQTKSVDVATASTRKAAPLEMGDTPVSALEPAQDAPKTKVVDQAALKPATEQPVAAVEEPAAPEVAVSETAPAAEVKPVVKTVKIKKIKPQAVAPEAEVEVAAAANVPLVEARPSDQPVNIVAKTGKTPDAAPEAEAVSVPVASSGAYVIQIASAPSPDAAQSTYSTLSRKFGNVIGGRAVTIQKADIPGKGTFYRVRIAAGSKKEAAALCTKYKSAGGQCLVAR